MTLTRVSAFLAICLPPLTSTAFFFDCDINISGQGHSHFYADENAALSQCESVSSSGACFATGRVNSIRPLANHVYFYCTAAGVNDNSTVFFAYPTNPCLVGEPDINTG